MNEAPVPQPSEKGIDARQARQKEQLVEELKRTPIVQFACKKIGIGRTTYYRWRKDDTAFTEAADAAIEHGAGLINDMAESQLIAAIHERNLTAVIYWLKHHHPTYATKVEVTAHLKSIDEKLTPEQEETVRRAIALASLAKLPPVPDTHHEHQ